MTYVAHMSEAAQESARTVPQWTPGDRLRKARVSAGLSQAELAFGTGIARTSIVSYEADRTGPSRPVLLAWSMATGISFEWLCHGDTGKCGPGKGITPGQRPSRWENSLCSSTALTLTAMAA